MTDIQHPGHLAQEAEHTLGYYVTDMEEGDPLVPLYTIEVGDRAGVALLRRLLTIDVKNLRTGQAKPSFILNALGNVMDIAFVSHLADREEHFRVSFHTAETLAWVHQVAKAFDAEFETLDVQTVRVWGNDLDRFGLSANTNRQLTIAEECVMGVHLGSSILLQGTPNGQWIQSLEGRQLDWIAANTLSIVHEESNAIDWMTGDMNPVQLSKTDWLDFSDAYRIFIGRALTEALAKHGTQTETINIVCEQPSGESLFADSTLIGIYTADGQFISKTYRVGMLGDRLIARIELPEGLDLEQCVWVNGESFAETAYRFEAL